MNRTGNSDFQRGLSALQAGKLKEAEHLLQSVIQAEPKHVAALNLLGVVFGRLGRNLEAVASYDRALALAPQSIESWYGRGMTLLAIGRLPEAIASFDRVIAAKPDFTQVHLLRAKLLSDIGRREAALEAIEKLLAIAPGLAEAWLGRSNILFEAGRYEAALSAAEKAVALKPNLAEAWHGLDNGADAFVDTAAVMTKLDLIITCDTSIAHLAGALGRPTWVALKHVPDWRWMLDREDSPWYPTMRLFRQPQRDDWASVFSKMDGALRALIR